MLLTFQSHIYKNKSQTHLTCINTHSHGSIYSYTFVSAAGNTSGNITELTGVFTESTHTNMPGYCTVRPNPALYLARVPSFKAKKSGKTQKKKDNKNTKANYLAPAWAQSRPGNYSERSSDLRTPAENYFNTLSNPFS